MPSVHTSSLYCLAGPRNKAYRLHWLEWCCVDIDSSSVGGFGSRWESRGQGTWGWGLLRRQRHRGLGTEEGGNSEGQEIRIHWWLGEMGWLLFLPKSNCLIQTHPISPYNAQWISYLTVTHLLLVIPSSACTLHVVTSWCASTLLTCEDSCGPGTALVWGSLDSERATWKKIIKKKRLKTYS